MKFSEIIESSKFSSYDDEDNDDETFSNHPELNRAFNVIWDWTRSESDSDQLDDAYSTFMEYRPQYAYTGDMYRVNALDPEVLDVPDTRLIMANLHKWALENPRHVVSWSKDTTSYGSDFTCGFILHQSSSGLDLTKLAATTFEKENEVLSPQSNSVSLYGFLSCGKFFPANKFADFVSYVRSQSYSGPYCSD